LSGRLGIRSQKVVESAETATSQISKKRGSGKRKEKEGEARPDKLREKSWQPKIQVKKIAGQTKKKERYPTYFLRSIIRAA